MSQSTGVTPEDVRVHPDRYPDLMVKNPLTVLGGPGNTLLIYASQATLVVEFLRHPGWLELLCSAAFAMNLWLVRQLLIGSHKLTQYRGLYRDLRRWGPEWTFAKLDLEGLCRAFGVETARGRVLDLNKRWLVRLQGMFGGTHTIARIHSPESQSSGGHVCYGNVFTDTFVLLESELEPASTADRFYLLHELGHALYAANYKAVAIFYHSKTALTLAMMGVAALDGPLLPLVSVATVLACEAILVWFFYRGSTLDRETYADTFALRNLDRVSRQKLGRMVAAYRTPILFDTGLSDRANEVRHQRFVALIAALEVGDRAFTMQRLRFAPSRMSEMISRDFWPSTLFGGISLAAFCGALLTMFTIDVPPSALPWALQCVGGLGVMVVIIESRWRWYHGAVHSRLQSAA
jgi:hypothetical protein